MRREVKFIAAFGGAALVAAVSVALWMGVMKNGGMTPDPSGRSPAEHSAQTNADLSAGIDPVSGLSTGVTPASADPGVSGSPQNAAASAGQNSKPAFPGPASTSPRNTADRSDATKLSDKTKSGDETVSSQLPLYPPPVPVTEILSGVDMTDPAQRQEAVAEMERLGEIRRVELEAKAAALGVPMRLVKPDGGVSELFAFRGDDPLYRSTLNAEAAISSAASLIRQTPPYNLSGAGLRVGVWDGGSVRATHREFGGRVTLRNPGSPLDDHGTHVAGTVAASGVDIRAKGMAPAVAVDSYDWDDDYTEMSAAGAAAAGDAQKLPISNHSYGYNGDLADQGRYEEIARGADSLANSLPFYLQFWAAGNEQKLFPTYGGYHTISFSQLAKNVVTVGAVNDAVTAGQRDPAKGTMSSFSSWGPTDDGRIKPDLVANGVELFSTVTSGDAAYEQRGWSGTSMASPSAAGSAALLVELFRREFGGQLPRASLLKALLIHTADDLGNAGPDYKFGWGLINVKLAADLLLEHKNDPLRPKYYEGSVSNAAKVQTYTFTWDGVSPIKATLCWTDPAGAAQSAVDSRTRNLVHDLDLRITAPDGTTVLRPYVMPFVGTWTTASMALPATTGDNTTDNVEQVFAANPGQSGTYTLTVTLDGSVTTPSQNFSLILTGAGEPVDPPPAVTFLAPANGAVITPGDSVTLRATATDSIAFGADGAVARVQFLANGSVIHTQDISPAQKTVEFTHPWVPAFGNYTLSARAVDTEGGEGNSAPVAIQVRYPLPGELAGGFTPPSADNSVRTVASDNLGRLYIGGSFSALNTGFSSPRLARLRPTGQPDGTFRVGTGFNGDVRCLLHSPDDAGIYAGGVFTAYRGAGQPGLVRLAVGHGALAEAAADPLFAPVFDPGSVAVNALARQHDGKLLVGGAFSMTATVDGEERRWLNLVRLHPNGAVDAEFGVVAGQFAPPNPSAAVNAIVVQPDGKILVGGAFSQVAGASRRSLVRLEMSGAVDTSLATGGSTGGFNGPVQALALGPDGSIYAGGNFGSYNNRAGYNNLAKLSPNGAIDGRFNYGTGPGSGLNGAVNSIQMRPTGEIMVSGLFTQVSNEVLPVPGTAVGRIVQLRPDGTVDPGFNPGGTGANSSVHGAAVLSDGNLVVVGAFSGFNGSPAARVALLAGSDGVVPLLTSGQSRTGAAGEGLEFAFAASAVEGSVTFELVSADGSPLPLVTDSATGLMRGPALPLGVFFDPTTGRLVGRPMQAGSFAIHVRPVRQPPGSSSLPVPGAVTPFTLHVLSGQISYEQWKQAWFRGGELADAAVSGPQSTARSANGLSNFAVYALWGGDPRLADRTIMPSTRFEWHGGRRYLTYSFGKNPLAQATHSVQFSEDLTAWHGAGTSNLSPVQLEDSANFLKFRAPVPSTGARRQFFRLRTTNP